MKLVWFLDFGVLIWLCIKWSQTKFVVIVLVLFVFLMQFSYSQLFVWPYFNLSDKFCGFLSCETNKM